MMTDDQILEVVSAHKEGKKIEFRYCCADQDGWSRWEEVLSTHMGFDFRRNEYRVAPEPPKPREWWLEFKNTKHAEVHNHNYCGDCVLVREVIGASSGNPTVDSDSGSSIP